MSHTPPWVLVLNSTPVKITPVKEASEPFKYINPYNSPSFIHNKMTTFSRIAKALMNEYYDLPVEEINALEDIMKAHKETEVNCWLIDQITNWVYEDTTLLMPVCEAYRLVKEGMLNE